MCGQRVRFKYAHNTQKYKTNSIGDASIHLWMAYDCNQILIKKKKKKNNEIKIYDQLGLWYIQSISWEHWV